MHSNSIHPPRIESYDRDTPLIEQIDGFYWDAFENQTRHVFNLSNWYVSFCGNLQKHPYGESDYAKYQTDITCEKNYPRYAGETELWNEGTSELRLDLANIQFNSYVHVGDRHFTQVGGTFLFVRVVRVRRPLCQGVGDLRDAENLKSYLVYSRKKKLIKEPADESKVSYPRTPEEIETETLNNRIWGKTNYTFEGNHTRYIYVTALDDSHLLEIYFDPNYWPLEYKKYSEKAKALVLEPLYDFLEHCHIENAESQGRELGRFEKESDKPQEEENDPEGW